MADTRRRVKLYVLNADRQWDDRGNGHVSSYIDGQKGMSLLVRAESDGSVLLESNILPDTDYQKQQETIIVWYEGDNFDLALSFQEKAGCDEIWENICQVQGKDPSVHCTQDFLEDLVEDFEDLLTVQGKDPSVYCTQDLVEDFEDLLTVQGRDPSVHCTQYLVEDIYLTSEDIARFNRIDGFSWDH